MVAHGALSEEFLELLASPIVLGTVVFLSFLIVGYIVGRYAVRTLTAVGISEMVEGTAFERSAQRLGSSTVSLMARLASWFIYLVGLLIALHILEVLDANIFWEQVTVFVPQLFVAILVIIIGVVVGEKTALVLAERLRGVKLPEVTVVTALVKYSVIFLAILIALGQIGVVTTALIVILAAYAFGLVFLAGIACRDLLSSGAAGIYLLLREPYGIGDEIRVGDRRGIVQEVDLFVTRIESSDAEFVVPNHELFTEGVAQFR